MTEHAHNDASRKGRRRKAPKPHRQLSDPEMQRMIQQVSDRLQRLRENMDATERELLEIQELLQEEEQKRSEGDLPSQIV